MWAMASILIVLIFSAVFTVVFLKTTLQKGKFEKKDAKTWLSQLSDAFWGVG